MPNLQPVIPSADGHRRFACSPAAVVVFIINQAEELLLLSHPKRNGAWEVISGALEAEETVLAGVLREVREEAGAQLRVRPLGPVHIASFYYDDNAHYMLSLNYLLVHEGGPVVPGDDMAGSQFRWWSLEALAAETAEVIIPRDMWLLSRAVDLYRLWKDERLDLQPNHPPLIRQK